MSNKIMIYGTTTKRAVNKAEEILHEIKYGDVEQVLRSSHKLEILLKDGTIYQTATANETSKGYVWQYAYIDMTIDQEIIDYVILPSFRPIDLRDKVEDYVEWY